ncbi:hypothetical protein K466DRAFT_28456 [Polyporus arcularius HHB13444]|uniref:Uncharacterized protein n=1 Tax=Polyporus arcularius HHB13444 TaxID=1314778 RepID=A0A5C3NP03_9APHY|nr:hypothetical protein K466DRAFT_28456 [Polyporus arcularius HHB13444]
MQRQRRQRRLGDTPRPSVYSRTAQRVPVRLKTSTESHTHAHAYAWPELGPRPDSAVRLVRDIAHGGRRAAGGGDDDRAKHAARCTKHEVRRGRYAVRGGYWVLATVYWRESYDAPRHRHRKAGDLTYAEGGAGQGGRRQRQRQRRKHAQ